MTLDVKKSDFSKGVNLPMFEDELGAASLTGKITNLVDGVTHVTITGNDALNNTTDRGKIRTTVRDHDGTVSVESSFTKDETTSSTTNTSYQEKIKVSVVLSGEIGRAHV